MRNCSVRRLTFKGFLLICFTLFLNLILFSLSLSFQTAPAKAASPDLDYNEQRVVELTNAKRAMFGLPPLRLNKELTAAARWFSEDSVVNRPTGFCGHQATDGSWPSDRDARFGYKGTAGAENAYCGYVTPEQAVEGWFNETPPNDGHRQNLLNPDSREIGVGYYLDSANGRGYVAQDFGQDAAYPPLVINNDAPVTSSANVTLYSYGAMPNAVALYAIGLPVQMKVSNRPDFAGANWETYSSTKNWTLDVSGSYGFKQVFVLLKDGAGKTTGSSDNIYYGPTVPYGSFDSLLQGSTQLETVNLGGLESGGKPYMQFSDNWGLNVVSGNMSLNWGNGGFVSDAGTAAGQAFRLQPDGSNESAAWLFTTSYMRNLPSQVYVRLKLSTLNAPNAHVRITVGAAEVNTELQLGAADFAAANVYQEFPVSFTQVDDPNKVFLTIQVALTDPDNQASLYIDRMDFYTAPEPFSPTKTWAVPSHNYRGSQIKVRYTDNASSHPAFSQPQLLGTYWPPSIVPLYAPLNLQAVAQSSSQIQLTWTDSLNTGASYYVERKIFQDGANWVPVAPVNPGVTSYADSGLSSGAIYYYRVRAGYGSQYSPYSNEASAITAGSWPVTNPVDNGPTDLNNPDTLSYALKRAGAGQAITFALTGGQTTIAVKGALQAPQMGVTIGGGCDGGGPKITLNGAGTPPGTVGLTLTNKNVTLYGLRISGFKGPGLTIPAGGGGNQARCLAIS